MAPFSAGGSNRPMEWASGSRGPLGLPVCFIEHHNSWAGVITPVSP